MYMFKLIPINHKYRPFSDCQKYRYFYRQESRRTLAGLSKERAKLD
ncbi:hypothetical protein Bdt_0146 [Bdellovibrio bacteriovorus str. Tiberius]|uniref:Uncharacterized protein n=1 Tax=Bdellovibrio bacteriovorus str. Tiberius TaxID=1069642 RepID=K7YJL3_BDEBC|nr:hypothetical protein Bdt_0146 [Bdellovibrio bacteriovorus str. Tiberius]